MPELQRCAVKALLERLWREYVGMKEKLEAGQDGVLNVLVKERSSGDGQTIQATAP